MSGKKRVIILVGTCLIVLVLVILGSILFKKNYFSEIKYDEIIEKIENDESFVVVISQTTCSHCARFKPKMEKVANKYKLSVYYIDVDLFSDSERDALKSYINYSGTPATIFIKDGEETSMATRINGDASIEKIENKLKSNGFIE